MRMFFTISRGETPKDAFDYAQLSGKNGEEIQTKTNLMFFGTLYGKPRPVTSAIDIMKESPFDIDTVGCIPLYRYTEDQLGLDLPAFLFFGY